ncbi:MAG: cyclase family protein [Syntrophales bacterium]|jgi:arylformamidase|nr:cyclase family protein [Syntrophales bacterium]
MKLYDISLSISNDLPVWPGDPPVSLRMTKSILNGDQCNVTKMEMGVHAGTHIDSPYHFLSDGVTTDVIPIETFIGPCLVVEVDSKVLIEKKDLQKYDMNGYSRILIKTRNSGIWANNISYFDKNFVALGIDAAHYLIEMKTILVGIDFLSIESFHSEGSPVHKLLLRNSISILEGLNLSGVSVGAYELICMPLKLKGCEGAPARVLLRESI